MKTYDITKLPTWAQQRIALLERKLASATSQLDTIGRPLEYSDPGVGYGVGVGDLPRRAIPSNEVSFVNKKKTRFSVRLQDDGILDINVSGYHGDCCILPGASNAFKVSCT